MSAKVNVSADLDSPRAVANKSHKENLIRAIRMALDVESGAVRHNTQTFNRNRYSATAGIADYDALKDEARLIKERAIERLPELIGLLERAIRARGGHFHLAETREDACRIILDVCRSHAAQLVVKGKSMTSEEVRLNRVLEEAGMEVAETDLAEFILQVADEQPSHIIAPAIHYSRERITALFRRKFGAGLPLDTGEELTKFAREKLREKFLHADIGITGANLIAADTGTLMLVESEGNIRMTTVLPPVHIAIAGVEKIVPLHSDLAPFLELLAASATGQQMTSYVSLLHPPLDVPEFALPGKQRKKREFHLVLVDNGRLRMREDPTLREALYCIRCSACLNSCANFQTVGGHAFGGETYSGGIGGVWEAGTGRLENARFSELCTGCSRCVPQCPVRIDIPWLNERLRERLNHTSEPSPLASFIALVTKTAEEDNHSPLQKIFLGNYHWFAKWGARLAPLSNWVKDLKLVRLAMESWLGLDRRRALPPFERQTLVRTARDQIVRKSKTCRAKAVLFADIYTNYGFPQRGLAAIEVLRALGTDLQVSEALPAGRAPLSQGMIATSKQHAMRAAKALERWIKEGFDIIVVEPSVLALFRRDYRHLLSDAVLCDSLRAHSFEAVEYVAKLLADHRLEPREFFDVARSPFGRKLFYHAHCQQKTIRCDTPTIDLLRRVGFDVRTSAVECCGMAGSFGYKKDFYELSMAVGEDLFAQVAEANHSDGLRVLVASGTSCTEQLHSGTQRPVLHPMQLLEGILFPQKGDEEDS